MKLHLVGHHLEITPAIRDYVLKRFERAGRHFDHAIECNVILAVEKQRCVIEAGVHVRGKDLFCESEDPDMYAAIDSLADKLDRAIVKHKEKSLGRRHADVVLRNRAAE